MADEKHNKKHEQTELTNIYGGVFWSSEYFAGTKQQKKKYILAALSRLWIGKWVTEDPIITTLFVTKEFIVKSNLLLF